MPIFIKYQYQIAGENDIKRSHTSIADHAIRENERVARSEQRKRSSRVTSATSATLSAREAGESLRSEEMRAKRAEVIREREAKRSADRAIKEHARAEREQTRTTDKEARERGRIEERWAAKNRQLKEHHLKALASREIEEARIVQRSRTTLANTLMSGFGKGVRAVGNIGRGALAVSGIGGVALAGNALHEGMKVERAAAGMANQMAAEGETPEQIAKRRKGIVEAATQIRGFSTYDAIQAARTFGGASGSYAGGQAIAKDLSEISLATDVDLQDIAKLAGNTYNKFKTPEMSESEAQKQTLQAVRIFAGQGNVGSVEIKDLAMYGGRLTAGAAKFEGSKLSNMARMGTLAQVAAGPGEAADAAEATEAAMRFASDLSEHSGKIEQLSIRGKKVSAFTDSSKTQLRGIKELIQDIVEGTGGSLPQMGDIFGARSQKMTAAFQQKYLQAERENEALAPEQRQAKGQAGRAAIAAEFDKFDKAALSEADQRNRAEAALTTTSMRVDEAMKRLNTQLSENLLPKLPPLIDALTNATPTIVEFVSNMAKIVAWAAENPFAGLAALISAALLKELIVADIGGVIKSILVGGTAAQIGTTAATGATSTALGGATGIAGTGGVVGTSMAVGTGVATGSLAVIAGATYLSHKGVQYGAERAREEEAKGAITQEAVNATGGDTHLLADLERKREEAQARAKIMSGEDIRGMTSSGAMGGGDAGARFVSMIIDLFRKPASEQEQAAKAIQNAAKSLEAVRPPVASATPNRGNTPSPVTG